MTDFDRSIWQYLFPNLTWEMVLPHRFLAAIFPEWVLTTQWGHFIHDFGFFLLVAAGFWGYIQFRFAPMHIAKKRGVNPALMTALTMAARTPGEVIGLTAYAHMAQPDAEAEAQKISAMEQAFGNALDARSPRGFPRGPATAVPNGNRHFRRDPKFN